MLFAGPWVGEFGWELMCFQAVLRAYAKDNGFEDVIVCTRPGHEFLYRDIVAGGRGYVKELDFPVKEINMWKNSAIDINRLMSSGTVWDLTDCRWFKPDNYMPGRTKLRSEYISYRQKDAAPITEQPTVLIHARNADHGKSSFRNWPMKHASRVAKKICNHGFIVASIGLRETALHVPGTVDMRGIDLNALSHLMSNAYTIIGPLSGPTHFATLCKLPQVTWVTCIHHEIRVRQTWNPFTVDVTVLRAPTDDYWRERRQWIPTEDAVVDAALDLMRKRLNLLK